MGDDTLTIAKVDGGTTTLPSEELAAFRTAHRGPVLRPGDAGYDDARQIWNAMIDRRPALIARCTGVADVIQAVRLARDHRLSLAVKSGGHNIAGLAICDRGLVVDLSLMKGVWVDPAARRARVQAGCTLGDVDRETQVHGLAAVLGFVSATGCAGLTVGGGFGYLTRRHGWTCDNVEAIDVVTADGEPVRTSAVEHPDLFWALRGGGGNFGVVTSFEYRLHPVGPEILGGLIVWRAEHARAVLDAVRDLAATSPRELTCVAGLRRAPPAPWLPRDVHGQPIVLVAICHTGPIADGERLIAPLRAVAPAAADAVVRRPYTQMQSILDATQPKGRRYYWKSEYVAAITPALVETVIAHAERTPSPHSAILLFQLDGALNELAPDHSPVGNREARWVVNIAGSWERPDDDAANVGWARAAWHEVRPLSTGVYLNFLTEDEGADRIAAAYGVNLARLAELKRRYDPDDLFRHTKRLS